MSTLKLLGRLAAKAELALAIILLAIIVFLVFIAAVARTLGHPIIWSVDMAQLLFIWVCFLGASRATREKSLLGIDLFVRLAKPEKRFYLELVLTLVILVFLGLLAYHGAKLTNMNWQRQFGDSGISYAWVTGAVPAGCVLLAVSFIHNIVVAFQRRNTGAGALIYSRLETDEAPESQAQ
ncbi:MAG: TRAP transporter small permease [Methylobacteriaceae bacterium]|jgi:TRAP-type C4-dicarboxylate transport system permease small subunit|nr:TRAP transporter small permease [Methylobacteriaceae bacterium]